MTMRRPGLVGKQEKSPFKPNTQYEWAPDQEFVLLGSELSIIMKSLQEAANTPEFRKYAAIYQGLSAINDLFKDAVEQGLVKEQMPEAEVRVKPPMGDAVGNIKEMKSVAADVIEPE